MGKNKKRGWLGGEIIHQEKGARKLKGGGRITWAGNVELMPWLPLPDDTPDIGPRPEEE